MIEEIAMTAIALAGAAAWVWGRDVQRDHEQAERRELFSIPDRGQLIAVMPRQPRKIPPIGTPGTAEYKASALYNKCLELGLDLDPDAAPIHKIGPRLITIAIAPGEEFDMKKFAPGTAGSKWQNICRDSRLKLNPELARCLPYIPGKHEYTGIEYQRFTDAHQFEPVLFQDILKSNAIKDKKIPIVIGKTARGDNYVIDLASARNPHYIVGGTTGAGKTILLRSMICSALSMPEKSRPDLALIDVAKSGDEFGLFDGHKSLIAPVITTPEQAAGFLKWIVEVSLPERGQTKQRRPLVIVFDEVADLFSHQSLGAIIADYCASITRIGRSLGVHLIMATQVLDADVFSQQIRGNTPGRLCLRTLTKMQGSQIIKVDGFDASKLLGDGDLMTQDLIRCQSALVDPEYIQALVENNQRDSDYQYRDDYQDTAPVADAEESNDHLKYYDAAIEILKAHRLTGISQAILKKELSLKSKGTVVRLLTELRDTHKIGAPGTAPYGRSKVLI